LFGKCEQLFRGTADYIFLAAEYFVVGRQQAFFQLGESIMLNKSKLIAAVAVAMLVASPALAQSFAKSYGTGNNLPSYYDTDGGLHIGAVTEQAQVAAQRHQVAQRATPEQMKQAREGDFYAPGKSVVQQPSAAEQNAFREGDFYAPKAD
jgi:hypothetical protein